MEQNFKLQNVQNLVLYHIIIAKEIAGQNYSEKMKKCWNFGSRVGNGTNLLKKVTS